MTSMISADTNAYWDAVRDHLAHDNLGGGLVVDNYGSLNRSYTNRVDRRELTSRYSWTVTAPETVAFVAQYCGGLVVDPLAGSGWWAYLLGEAGVTVFASDVMPPDGTDANGFHRHDTHVPVAALDAAAAVDLAPDGAALLLSWPPMDDTAFRALTAYRGHRLVFIGEGWGGCTADDDFFQMLERDWKEIAEHRPIQFYGLHDFITVYERNEAN